MATDPIGEFERLFAEARAKEPSDATASVLATSTTDGRPSARVVLLKGVDSKGFYFFTNYDSRKGLELAANPSCALCFYWPTLLTQVRVEGRAARVTAEESAAYFATRPRESQIGAWASRQSAPLGSREELVARVHEMESRFGDQPVPCPENWGGYLLTPDRIEFWSARDFRLHDRLLYVRSGSSWTTERLYP